MTSTESKNHCSNARLLVPVLRSEGRREQGSMEQGKGRLGGSENCRQRIPNIIFVKTRRQRTIMAPTGSGRRAGVRNYSDEELEALLILIGKILPVGPEQWKQVAQIHANKWPLRDYTSVRRKFTELARKKGGTGNPECPWDVKMAIGISKRIFQRTNMGDCKENYNAVSGYPGELNNDGANPDGANRAQLVSLPPSQRGTPLANVAIEAVNTAATATTEESGISELEEPTLTKTPSKRSYISRQERGEEMMKAVSTIAEGQKEALLSIAKGQENMQRQFLQTMALLAQQLGGGTTPQPETPKRPRLN